MADPKREYFEFYLMGRDEAQDDASELELDYAEMGKRVVDSSDGPVNVRDVAMVAAKDAAKPTVTESVATWKSSSRRLRKEIDLAGGDAARAHKLYCAGFIDELAHEIEGEILQAIANEGEVEDGDDDADKDEGGEDEDDDDDDGPRSGNVDDD
jgi:hypothetical protein